jgi:hypothetical protein
MLPYPPLRLSMLPQDSVAHNYFGWGKPSGTLATIWAKSHSYVIMRVLSALADNPVEHSCTKHIDIWHHFLRDHQQKGDIEVFYVSTENQLADIFTKPLDEKTFCRLRSELNVLDSRNLDWFIAYMCSMPWSCSLCILLFIYGAQVVQSTPRTSQVHLQVMHIFGGDMLQLDSLGLTMCLSVLKLVSKVDWKGKVDLDHERLPLHSDEKVTNSKFIFILLLPFSS